MKSKTYSAIIENFDVLEYLKDLDSSDIREIRAKYSVDLVKIRTTTLHNIINKEYIFRRTYARL